MPYVSNYQILITKNGDKYYLPVKNQIMRETAFQGCDGTIHNNKLSGCQKAYLQNVQSRIAHAVYLQGHQEVRNLYSDIILQ